MRHILVVDDSEDLLLQYEFSFRSLKYKVTTAQNGDIALAKLESLFLVQEPVDVVLVDMQISGAQAIDFISTLREYGVLIPIIAISLTSNKEMLIELMRRGCSDFVEKPVSFGELYTRIEESIKRQCHWYTNTKNRINHYNNRSNS